MLFKKPPLLKRKRFLISLLLLLVLLVPFSVRRYDDGGTIRVQALSYTVMVWKRNLKTMDQDGNLVDAPAPGTRIYFFPESFKDYNSLWESAFSGA